MSVERRTDIEGNSHLPPAVREPEPVASSQCRLGSVFAGNVRRRHIELGFSQEALAERASVHRTYVRMLERGEKNVTIYNIERIADALEAEPASLLHRCREARKRYGPRSIFISLLRPVISSSGISGRYSCVSFGRTQRRKALSLRRRSSRRRLFATRSPAS
ncbi:MULTISPECIES: helix-turn-helix domain-containing protein [Paraburkholderia]|uniref:helix-turn-helix domain-containing protein n=1 Tax=Paraburkholderia TaxID=1822464 RepID=UPI001C25D502